MKAIPNRFKHHVYRGFYDGILSRFSGEASDPYWRMFPDNSLQVWRAEKAGYIKNNTERRAYITGFNAALTAGEEQVKLHRESNEDGFTLRLVECGLVASGAE